MKNLTKLAKKFTNYPCQVKDGKLYLFNGNTWLIVPVNLEDKIYLHTFEVCRMIENNMPVTLPAAGDVHAIVTGNVSMPEISFEKVCTLESIEELKKAAKFAGKDQLHPVITGIYFDRGKIVGTDAYVLYFNDLCPFDTSFIVPAEVISLLNPGSWDVSVNGEQVKFEGEYVVISNLIPGKYPAWDRVIPQDNPVKLSFRKKEVISLIDFLLPFSKNSLMIFTGGGMQVINEDTDVNIKREYSYKIEGGEVRTGINLKLFKRVLSALEEDIILEYSASNRAMVLNGKTLLMPVYIND